MPTLMQQGHRHWCFCSMLRGCSSLMQTTWLKPLMSRQYGISPKLAVIDNVNEGLNCAQARIAKQLHSLTIVSQLAIVEIIL